MIPCPATQVIVPHSSRGPKAWTDSTLPLFVGSALASAGVDQLAKRCVQAILARGAERPILDGFFYLTHVRNRGGSFGFFAAAPDLLRLALLIGGSVVAMLLIVAFYRRLRPGDRRSSVALGLVMGGVGGNLIDRVSAGGVIDFLRFCVSSGYRWPDFNLADVLVVAGVTILVLDSVPKAAPVLATVSDRHRSGCHV
jgi:signal peptidase II